MIENLQSLFDEILFKLNLPDQFAVAVSGGVDSMVLMNLIQRSANHRYQPTVLTVNHGLRAEADEETSFVKEQAEILGFNCQIFKCDTKCFTGNIQNAARKLRYELMINWCEKNNIHNLLLAHHRNDQAETLLMRLERGSGVDGLAAMPLLHNVKNVSITRPLLKFSKNELLQYATINKIQWMNDPSNENPSYRRTFFRNLINLSDSPDVLTQRLLLTSEHARRMLKAIEHFTANAIEECVEIDNLGYIIIHSHQFSQLPEEIAQRVLLYSLMAMSNRIYKPRYKNFHKLFCLIRNHELKKSTTLCECKITIYKQTIIITREISNISKIDISIGPKESKMIEWDNRLVIVIKTSENFLKQALVIQPLGKHNAIPSNLHKLMRDCASTLPIVVNSEKILAYPSLSCNNHGDYGINIYIDRILIRERIKSLTECKT